MNSRKISAFTLTEVLVVLVLLSIIVVLSFNTWRLTETQYQQIINTQSEVNNYQHFRQLIQSDFLTAKYILIEDNQLILAGKRSTKDRTYTLLPKKVLLKYQSDTHFFLDTLPVKVNIVSSAFGQHSISNGLTDLVVLSLGAFKEKQYLYLNKKYSAEDMIEYNRYEN